MTQYLIQIEERDLISGERKRYYMKDASDCRKVAVVSEAVARHCVANMSGDYRTARHATMVEFTADLAMSHCFPVEPEVRQGGRPGKFLVIHVNSFTRKIDGGYLAYRHDGKVHKDGKSLTRKAVAQMLVDWPDMAVDFLLV